MKQAFDKTPFDEGEVEWTPQMIYEYLDETCLQTGERKKSSSDHALQSFERTQTEYDSCRTDRMW